MSRVTFFREFLKEPTRLGSIVPSSPALARAVVQTADVRPHHAVVELGAGTGPITRALVAAHPQTPLLVFEPTASLADVLERQLPNITVRRAYADAHLADACRAWGHHPIDRVVSGLPWTMWPDDLQDDVFEGITSSLADDGRFLTYTYVSSQLSPAGKRFRRTMDRWFHHVWRSPVVWANVPPAVVLVGDRPRRRRMA